MKNNKKPVLTKLLSLLIFTIAALPLQAQTYEESNGLVIMEAENTTSTLGKWVRKTEPLKNSFSGPGYLEFTGNTPINGDARSPLHYAFKIKKAGLYYLYLHCAKENLKIKGKKRTDIANDCYVRVEGNYGAGPNAGNKNGDDAPLRSLKKNTKFFGGDDKAFAWATGNRLDLGGHGNKRVAVYNFKADTKYKLVISGRSQFFKLNRIVFCHAETDKKSAKTLSSEETLASLTPIFDNSSKYASIDMKTNNLSNH